MALFFQCPVLADKASTTPAKTGQPGTRRASMGAGFAHIGGVIFADMRPLLAHCERSSSGESDWGGVVLSA